jgi:hypothetical protein
MKKLMQVKKKKMVRQCIMTAGHNLSIQKIPIFKSPKEMQAQQENNDSAPLGRQTFRYRFYLQLRSP